MLQGLILHIPSESVRLANFPIHASSSGYTYFCPTCQLSDCSAVTAPHLKKEFYILLASYILTL